MKDLVLSITPNPALDMGGIVEDLRPNEKSYVHNETVSPGGNAINVARILHRLKAPVLASGFLGGGTGEEVISFLNAEGVPNKFIKIQGRTRICVTVSNNEDHNQTRLTFPGPKVLAGEKKELSQLLQKQKNVSYLVLGGSLPQGFTSKDILASLKYARQNNIRTIIDCPGNILRKVIAGEPLLIKPNLLEFQELTGSSAETLNNVHKKAKDLNKKIPLVCVSSVEKGALLVTQGGSFFGRIPQLTIKSTVGAGDSMVAGMIYCLAKGEKDGAELLRWGLAAAASTLSHAGTAFGSATGIRKYFKLTKVHKYA